MFAKIAVLLAVVACALAAPKPGFVAHTAYAGPVVAAAPVAVAHSVPVATSYSNTYKVSVKSPIVAAAPLVAAHAAPIAYASPIIKAPAVVAHAAPLAYAAHAPVLIH